MCLREAAPHASPPGHVCLHMFVNRQRRCCNLYNRCARPYDKLLHIYNSYCLRNVFVSGSIKQCIWHNQQTHVHEPSMWPYVCCVHVVVQQTRVDTHSLHKQITVYTTFVCVCLYIGVDVPMCFQYKKFQTKKQHSFTLIRIWTFGIDPRPSSMCMAGNICFNRV